MALEKIASALGRNDERANVELACELCLNEDKNGIEEMIKGITGEDRAVANDCIKVLYEIGERKPKLIEAYVKVFISLLRSRNNRLAWGSMTALTMITDLRPTEVYAGIATIKRACKSGSVITVDNSITVFAKLCMADKKYEQELMPILINHLKICRPKDVAQHAERMFICINEHNYTEYMDVLKERRGTLKETAVKRIDRLLKQVQAFSR